MKKNVIAFALCMLVVGFGFTEAKRTLELNVGMSNLFQPEQDIIAYGAGVGFQGKALFTDRIGFGLGMHFNIPTNMQTKLYGYEIVLTNKDFDILFGVEMLMGCVLYAFKNDSIGIPITPGLHLQYLFSHANGASSYNLSIGVGVDPGVEFYIGKHFFMRVSCQVAVDFFNMAIGEVNTAAGRISAGGTSTDVVISCYPKVSAGYRF